MTDKENIEYDPSNVDEISRLWRKDWSNRSRSEILTRKGPGFFLWRSNSDGIRSSGMFYTRNMVKKALHDPAMAKSVIKLIDETDHQMMVVVVLGFETQEKAVGLVIDKLEPPSEQKWFEMPEIRRRSLSNSVWLPLRVSEKLISEGKHAHEGFREEYFGLGSVIFPIEYAQNDLKLEWSDIGISNNYTGGENTKYHKLDNSFESKKVVNFHIPLTNMRLKLDIKIPSSDQTIKTTEFHPTGVHNDYNSNALGTGLVIEQYINSEDPAVWHLHQDFVVSLRLIREGDKWLRPAEGYLEVARLVRDELGNPVKLEVRSEHLRDYLSARAMNLYISSYRSRVEVCDNCNHIKWDSLFARDSSDYQNWEGRVSEIHEGGFQYGSKTAVFHMARTDVDDEEDVPTFKFPTDDNVKSDSWTKEDKGRKLYRIEGELWRTEVIESGSSDERISRDDPQNPTMFIVDATGKTESKETLIHGDSRWLWFKPEVMREFLGNRGAHLDWYTKETGSIGIIPDSSVHFGINDLGLINVYAKDIGRLSNWEQRKWVGFNISPDGKVSKELLDAQMRALPANTSAPEAYLKGVYDYINQEFIRLTGRRLFGSHQAIDNLFLKAHRFRSLDRSGLFELAKDLARLTVESIDGKALNLISPPPKGTNSGSIKHLETVLTTFIGQPEARKITGVLIGINELRQADAHLPSSDLIDSITLAGITKIGNTVKEAEQMMDKLVSSLYAIGNAFEKI